MDPVFEELDFQSTPIGDISLRRRSEPMLEDTIVYEIKLGDEFLMSSLFTEAERRLATLALATSDEAQMDVVVGGLGLGFTAAAALDAPNVRSLTVIELLAPVIDWHRNGLVPNGRRLVSDSRCSLVHDDFFELALRPETGFEIGGVVQPAHAVLLDIDHSPSQWLDSANSRFYSSQGLRSLAAKLHPGGVFGIWSNEPADEPFLELLEEVFESAAAHLVAFPNPYTGGESSSTVYVGKRSKQSD